MDVSLMDPSDASEEFYGTGSVELPGYLDDLVGRSTDQAETEDGADGLAGDSDDEESQFYSCHVCGDNWLSVRCNEPEGDCRLTFIHQMGVQPTLRRVAYMKTEIVLRDRAVDRWEYFLDDDEVDESEWLGRLESRRKVLKSICSN